MEVQPDTSCYSYMMATFKIFLENSTIHGLSYIASTRRLTRLFWILVVIAGFIGAFTMIYQSFQSWAESPITTTIETLPINEITFPKVTVCPPKEIFTNLNVDIAKADHITFDNKTREKLLESVEEYFHDAFFDESVKSLETIKEEKRFHNWYNGYTGISLPYKEGDFYVHNIFTSEVSGSISSINFKGSFLKDEDLLHVKTYIEFLIPEYLKKRNKEGL